MGIEDGIKKGGITHVSGGASIPTKLVRRGASAPVKPKPKPKPKEK